MPSSQNEGKWTSEITQPEDRKGGRPQQGENVSDKVPKVKIQAIRLPWESEERDREGGHQSGRLV